MSVGSQLNGSTKRIETEGLLTHVEWQMLGDMLRLSQREQQILEGLCANLKDDQVARALGMSPHTMRSHIERLYRKLEVTSRTELLLRVFRAYMTRMRTPWDEAPTVEIVRHRLK